MDRILTDEQATRVEQFELDCEKVEALLQRAGREVNQGLLRLSWRLPEKAKLSCNKAMEAHKTTR